MSGTDDTSLFADETWPWPLSTADDLASRLTLIWPLDPWTSLPGDTDDGLPDDVELAAAVDGWLASP